MPEIKIAEMLINIGNNASGFSWTSFFTPMFASLAGAGVAFKLNAIHEEKKENRKNLDYLIYSISSLQTLFNYLIQFREQSTRKADFQKQLDYLDKFTKEEYKKYKKEENTNKDFSKLPPQCFKPIILDAFDLPINFEQLQFITRINTKIIGMLGNPRISLSILNKTLQDLNNHIGNHKNIDINDELKPLIYFEELVIKWKTLDSTIDNNIYIIYLMLLCLVKIGGIMDKNFTNNICNYNKKGFEHLELNYKPKGYEDLEKWTQE